MVHVRGRWIKISPLGQGYWRPSNSIVGQTIFENETLDNSQPNSDFEHFKTFLQGLGIPFRIKTTKTSEQYSSKRWIVIPSKYPLNQLEEQVVKEYAKKETKTFHE